MSRVICIVGDTGTGKSTAIKHLDPKSTYIINPAKKELPFKGSSKLYNSNGANYAEISDAKSILSYLQNVSEKAPHIKTVIIDDANYIMGFSMVDKAMETGYTKFSIMAKDMKNLIMEAKVLRNDLLVVYMSHPEVIKDGDEIVSYKMKTAGQLLDKEIKLEGLFTVVLYTNVEEASGGKMKYEFVTNRWKKYPAKSPAGMFEDIKIPNDLNLVSEKIKEYYN